MLRQQAQSRMESWQRWLTPISEINPTGEDPGYDDDFQRIREEVNKLSSIDTGLICQLAEKVLITVAKDVRVATYYCWARLHQDGETGFAEGLELLAGLLTQYGTQLHPQRERSRKADLHRINFYRLCQLLEKRNPGRPLMGSTSHPGDDPVRFAPHPGMGFPASELKAVEYDEDDDSRPPRIRTTFMGMYGVDSPLPMAYLDDIAQRREGHDALQGFLDIFSHRILTQFYRIWRKYSYPATFEPGGTDSISQSLLGLVGLGIPGTADHIATPVSRFLALLGVLQQPGKTQEGMQALVTLLAPDTTVKVSPYCLRPVEMGQPLGFYGDDDFLLDGNTPLGDEAMDAGSQLLVALTTDNEQEAQGWKPDGLLYQDFLVMLRVWLGWRFKAKITLTTRTRLLAVPPLGEGPFWLGMNGVLGADEGEFTDDIPPTFTTELGYYTGLKPAIPQQGNRRVTYKFD